MIFPFSKTLGIVRGRIPLGSGSTHQLWGCLYTKTSKGYLMGQQLTASISYPLDQYRFPIATLATRYKYVENCLDMCFCACMCAYRKIEKERGTGTNRDL